MDGTFSFLLLSYAMKMLSYLIGSKNDYFEFVGKICAINLYPIKSMRNIKLQSAVCTKRGIKHPHLQVFDRNFLVVDGDGKFLHGNSIPKLISITTSIQANHLVLESGGHPPLYLEAEPNLSGSNVIETKIWGESIKGHDCGEAAAKWLEKCVNKSGIRLIYCSDGFTSRELKKQTVSKEQRWKKKAKDGDTVTYQDGYPFMLTTQSSLDDLNQRRPYENFEMASFRPNIVVSDTKPFDEDTWSRLYIGKARFSTIKPCTRCSVITIKPDQGLKAQNTEPLNTLRMYRLDEAVFGKSPIFGVYLVLDSPETISIDVGDKVFVKRK